MTPPAIAPPPVSTRQPNRGMDPSVQILDVANLAVPKALRASAVDVVVDPIRFHRSEIEKFPLLSAQEQFALGYEIKNLKARFIKALFSSNLIIDEALAAMQVALQGGRRTQSVVIFKTDGSDGLGGTAAVVTRVKETISEVKALQKKMRSGLLRAADPSISDAEKRELVKHVRLCRSRVCQLLAQTNFRRSYLKQFKEALAEIAKSQPRSCEDGQQPVVSVRNAARDKLFANPTQLLAIVEAREEQYEAARQRLWQTNQRLVWSIAYNYRSSTKVPHLDLIAHGNVGLATGIDGWDPSRGILFTTYAGYWIRQSIQQARCENADVTRVKLHGLKSAAQIIEAERAFLHANLRQPSIEELATSACLTEKRVFRFQGRRLGTGSLDKPASNPSDGRDGSLAALVPSKEPLFDREMALDVRHFTSPTAGLLDDRERIVLALNSGLWSSLTNGERAILAQLLRTKAKIEDPEDRPISCKKIGLAFGVTRQAIDRINERGQEKLRLRLTSQEIPVKPRRPSGRRRKTSFELDRQP